MRQLLSSASLVCMIFALVAVGSWRDKVKAEARQQKRPIDLSDVRFLVETIDQDAPALDDDTTKSKKCKEYLQNFLNGTTDQSDQCSAFSDAYKAADCEEDTALSGTVDHRHQMDNGTWTDDDVLIDDFFENWSCCRNMRRIFERNCESERDWHSSWSLMSVLVVLLVCNGTKALLRYFQLHWIPDACAFILCGSFLGGMLSLFNITKKLSFDNDLFMSILLPPILHHASLTIDKNAFKRNLFSILSLAFFGTAFCAFSIGWVVHHMSKLGAGKSLPLIDSLVFGSLISSIDPVATLGILSSVGVSRSDTLYILIFGESLLNDGVSIVLFDVLTPFLGKDVEITDRDYHSMVNHFIAVLLGSICVGLACGALCTLYFYFLRNSTGPVSEVGSFFCWALIPYYIADGIGCSGIISIMVMGFTSDYFVIGGFQSEDVAWMDYMAIRTDHELRASNHLVAGWSDYIFVVISTAFSGTGHILARSRHHVGFVSELLSEMFETALFSYLGLFLFNDSSWNLRLNSTGIFGCVVSRIVMVVSLSLVINMAIFFDLSRHLRRVFQSTRNPGEDVLDPSSQDRVFIDHRAQLIIILSGIRGAVSFALVESIPVYNTVAKSGSQFKPELKAMTSSSIVFTLFVFGALTYFTVEREPSNLRSSRVTGPLTRRRARSEPLDNEGENTNGSSGMHEYSSTPHERSVVRGASAFNVENSDNPRMVPLLNDFGESS